MTHEQRESLIRILSKFEVTKVMYGWQNNENLLVAWEGTSARIAPDGKVTANVRTEIEV